MSNKDGGHSLGAIQELITTAVLLIVFECKNNNSGKVLSSPGSSMKMGQQQDHNRICQTLTSHQWQAMTDAPIAILFVNMQGHVVGTRHRSQKGKQQRKLFSPKSFESGFQYWCKGNMSEC